MHRETFNSLNEKCFKIAEDIDQSRVHEDTFNSLKEKCFNIAGDIESVIFKDADRRDDAYSPKIRGETKDEDDFVSDNIPDYDICENDCEIYSKTEDDDCVGTYGNTASAKDFVHQDTVSSLNEKSLRIAEVTESVILKDVDGRDDAYCPKMRGETYGAVLGKIFSEPSFLTSLLIVPFWPVMEYMDIITSD